MKKKLWGVDKLIFFLSPNRKDGIVRVLAFKKGSINLVDLMPDPPKKEVPIRGSFLDSKKKDKRKKKS